MGLLSIVFVERASAQLTVTTSSSAVNMASTITGSGVTVINQVLDCTTPTACGTFNVVPGTLLGTGTTVFGINSGILLTTGHATAAAGPEAGTTSFNNGFGGDPTMTALALTASTYDRCELSFDFIPQGDSVSFNYIFGSEEYIHSTCGSYDDAFAFFISGPGITGTVNMATIPGTNVPVLVNTVNCGAGCVVSGFGTYSNCTSIAAGSPFTAYYVDNTGGTNFAYRGYTTKLTAASAVTPCDTYHLKMAIVDAGNGSYDSGVFIEAGSLHSSSVHFDHTVAIGSTIEGVPNAIVKGCTPASVTVISTPASSSATTVTLSYGGTAVSGTDYTAPATVTIPGGSTSATFSVTGIPTLPAGTKTVKIFVHSGCGALLDSVTINLLDTPTATILTPDTSVCGGSVLIRTTGTTGLTYSWTPATGLSSATVAQPTATPSVTTTYTMTATLPGSGCPPIVRSVTISVGSVGFSINTPDTTICSGDSVNLHLTGATGMTFLWTPTTGLNNATLMDPVATPTVTTTYSVTGSLPGSGCTPATHSITITVVHLNEALLTPDTGICAGQSFVLRDTATAGATFSWSPGTGLSSTTIAQPTAAPSVTTTYTVTVTLPGCAPIVQTVSISVATLGLTINTPDTTICLGDSVNLRVTGAPGMTYSWSPASFLNNASVIEPVATPTVTTTYSVTGSLPSSGCPPATESITITVGRLSDSLITPDTVICLGQSFVIREIAAPGSLFSWAPATGLSSASVQNPTAAPSSTTTYSVTVSNPSSGCAPITNGFTVIVEQFHPSVPTPDTAVCYHSAVQLDVNGSSLDVFNWAPATGLSNAHVANPFANPQATTTYTVTVDSPGSACPAVSLTETVRVIQPIAVGAQANIVPCSHLPITLAVEPSGTGYTCQWTGPNGFTSTQPNPSIDSPTLANQGMYTVVVTVDSTGCTQSDSVYADVAVINYVHLTQVTQNETIALGSSVQLNADSANIFFWYPDNGTLSNPNINNPVATPTQNTTYFVVGMNGAGCRDTAAVTITVVNDSIFIPDAFTPNGDGLNDYFHVVRLGYFKLVSVSVFNRWGELVYQDNSGEAHKGWDGTYKGMPTELGVYFYYVVVMTPQGVEKTFKGDVTLIR